jgi:hypothetical protein
MPFRIEAAFKSESAMSNNIPKVGFVYDDSTGQQIQFRIDFMPVAGMGYRLLGELWNSTETIEIKQRPFEGELEDDAMQTLAARVAADALRHYRSAKS